MRRFLWVAVIVAIAGEGGHRLCERYGGAAGHHVFHIAIIGGASLVFIVLAICDIRRNGRPRCSWQLGERI